MLTFLILLTVFILCTAFAVFLLRRNQHSVKQAIAAVSGKAQGKDQSLVRDQLEQFDTAIQLALVRIKKMAPLDEIRKLEARLVELSQQYKKEQETLLQLSESLSRTQADSREREAQHSQIKLGREEAQRLADEIASHTVQMEAEYKRLESEIAQSKQQMEALAQEVILDAEQKKAVDEIAESLDKVGKELQNLAHARGQAAERFENLRKQYADLEREYKKLVESELQKG